MSLTIRWSGDGVPRLTHALEKVRGPALRKVVVRALNHTGERALTIVKRTVAKQAGVTQKDALKYGAIRARRAMEGRLEYVILSTGSGIPLNAFKASETRKGVSAAPWNVRRVFPGSFIVKKFGGHVFMREDRPRFPIKKLFGPSIPKEIVKDATATAFRSTVSARLPARVEHEIRVLTKGIVS